MTRKQRVIAALEGRMQALDRPPVSLWYHFGTAFLDGRRAADLQVAAFRHYDFDFLKMMNDYPWPLPAGMEAAESVEDLGRFGSLALDEPSFREQLASLARAARLLGRDALVIDTVFNPFGIARRTLKASALPLLREAPEAMLGWLETCTENLVQYLRAAARTGIGGIFFSVNGAEEGTLSDAEFERFVEPFDRRVLQACRQVGPLVVGHVHGQRLRMDRVLGYPVTALNWSHLHDNESIAAVRPRWKGCIIGGIDEVGTGHLAPAQIVSAVRSAAAEASGGGFMAGPGCAIPTDTPPDVIRAARRAVEELRSPSRR